jgi:CheY-specific phosphatase CheX
VKETKNNGWNEWSRHVLSELGRLNTAQGKIEKHINKISIDIATLKVKSGIWGAIAGMIPSAIILIIMLLRKG